MKKFAIQVLSFFFVLCLLCSAAPAASCYTVGEPWEVDLTNFLDNEEKRGYIQMMLDHYLRTDKQVQQSLADGYCAMFFFEGCSDNMDDPSLSDLSFFRVTGVCIVVKLDENGEPYITYFSPNCSTIPDRPLEYGAWSFADVGDVGPATICDGTYEIYSVKHMGVYEALHMRDSYDDGELSAVYMVPEGGYVTKDANSINIHTRTSNHTSGRGMWSAGCLLVGDGNYGQFLDMMDGTYYTVHDFFQVDKPVGTVSINRQYLKNAMYALYENEDAVDMLLAASRHMLPEAYLEQCTREDYREAAQMQTRRKTRLMTLPCTNEEDARSLMEAELEEKTQLELTAKLWNPENQIWYETVLDGRTCYISAEDLKPMPGEGWFSRLLQNLFG
nr:hypothetical protein [Oscillospiraceae bacterium]